MSDAQNVRAEFFKNVKPIQRREYTYNGMTLEFLQPSVGEMINKADSDTEKAFFIRAMIQQTVVPGTNDRVFDEADYDALLELPADGDFQEFTKVVTDVMALKVDDKVKN